MRLFEYLSRNIIGDRIMLIGTYRKEDIAQDEKMREIIDGIKSKEKMFMHINPLSIKFLKRMFENLNDETLKYVYEKSRGNPLLAAAIVENLEGKEVKIPESIRESIEMRIDSLDDRTLYFLRFLSVLGEEVDVEDLRNFYSDYSRYLEKVGDRFIKNHDGKIRFLYSTYRDVFYRGMAKDVRRDMHRKIGKFMEEKGNVMRAAYHYYLAGDRRAIKFLKEAAESAVKMMAIRDAIDYYEKALEIARKYGLKNEIYEI